MDATLILITVLIVLNIPVYLLIGWVLFSDWGEFWECVRFWLTPDVISLFRGEWGEDWWAEMKLGVFSLACAACVYGEFLLSQRLFF